MFRTMMSPGVHVWHYDEPKSYMFRTMMSPRVHVWQYDERKKPEPNNTVTVVVNDAITQL